MNDCSFSNSVFPFEENVVSLLSIFPQISNVNIHGLSFESKYGKWYCNIINAALRTPHVSYTENHHIIPGSLGGSDDAYNRVRLSAKHHFICHLLLVKMATTTFAREKMIFASTAMMFYKNENHKRVWARNFEKLRLEKNELVRRLMTGRYVSDETRRKMSIAQKGKPASNKGIKYNQEVRARMRAAQQGKVVSEEVKAKLRKFRHTEESRAKMSLTRTGRSLSIEHRKAIASGNAGIKPSDTTRKAVAEANKHRILTDAQRKAMSDKRTGKLWVNLNGLTKLVSPDEAKLLAVDGWILGRGGKGALSIPS